MVGTHDEVVKSFSLDEPMADYLTSLGVVYYPMLGRYSWGSIMTAIGFEQREIFHGSDGGCHIGHYIVWFMA